MRPETKTKVMSYVLLISFIVCLIHFRLGFIVGLMFGSLSVFHLFYKRNPFLLWVADMQKEDPYIKDVIGEQK